MVWKRGEGEKAGDHTQEDRTEPIQIQRDAPRPTTILRVADELEQRGGKIGELFKEIEAPDGHAVLPIHLIREGEDIFVEVETGPWDETAVRRVTGAVAALHNSDYAGAGFELLSAYPVPDEVAFLFGRSPVALFQLDLFGPASETPEDTAGRFMQAAGRHWETELDYDRECLPLVEEVLLSALGRDSAPDRYPVLEALVEGLGCYLGEVIRHNAGVPGEWVPAEEWGEVSLLEVGDFYLDPVGKARAFLENGSEDSVAFYADYALEQIAGAFPEESRDQP